MLDLEERGGAATASATLASGLFSHKQRAGRDGGRWSGPDSTKRVEVRHADRDGQPLRRHDLRRCQKHSGSISRHPRCERDCRRSSSGPRGADWLRSQAGVGPFERPNRTLLGYHDLALRGQPACCAAPGPGRPVGSRGSAAHRRARRQSHADTAPGRDAVARVEPARAGGGPSASTRRSIRSAPWSARSLWPAC